MSQHYEHLIFELAPSKFYFLADEPSWGEDDGCEPELSRYPKRKGGPFNSQDEAVEAMVSRYGNPGFIQVWNFDTVEKLEDWKRNGLKDRLNHGSEPDPSDGF